MDAASPASQYQNYSVPYKFVHKKVDVRYTDTLVEVFTNNIRIASHTRLHGSRDQHSTITEHMPPQHQLYSEWDGNRFRRWAKKVGPNTSLTIDRLLASYVVEEQTYKGCLSNMLIFTIALLLSENGHQVSKSPFYFLLSVV